MQDSRVFVVGAGIGGLAAALALLRAGQRVRLYEQVAELGEVGAGLSITPNAGKALIAIGLGPELERIGSHPPAGAIRHYASGEVLVKLNQDMSLTQYGVPLYHMHRADLHAALAAAVRAIDPDCIQLGCALVSLESRADGVEARFANGQVAASDWLVGADGIHSAVRAALFGRDTPHFTGYVAWRGLVPGQLVSDELLDPPLCMTVGPRRLLMRYPLRNRALINYVAIAQRDAWTEEGWSVRSGLEEVRREFSDFEPNARRLLDLTPVDRLFKWGLFDREPIPTWTPRPCDAAGRCGPCDAAVHGAGRRDGAGGCRRARARRRGRERPRRSAATLRGRAPRPRHRRPRDVPRARQALLRRRP